MFSAADDPGPVWTQSQFDEMSWHDNHVHALRVVEGEYGAGELMLDLDYITEWVRCGEGTAQFRILPATLKFLDVTALRIVLDYETPTAGLCPFSIDEIQRRFETRERYQAQIWTIVINWPAGDITFEARGYELRGHGPEILSDAQCLKPEERSTHR